MFVRLSTLAFAGLTLICHSVGADEEPPDLASARTTFEKDLDFATRPLRDRYLSKLDMLKRSLGSRGDARGAVAVQEEIERVRATILTPRDLAKFAGTWKITYANNATNIFVIRPNGSVRTEDPGAAVQLDGRVQWKDSAFILEFDENKNRDAGKDRLWTLSLTGNTLDVAYFEPRTNFPRGPVTLRGKGVKLSDSRP